MGSGAYLQLVVEGSVEGLMGRIDALSVLNKCVMECVNVTAVAVNITHFQILQHVYVCYIVY